MNNSILSYITDNSSSEYKKFPRSSLGIHLLEAKLLEVNKIYQRGDYISNSRIHSKKKKKKFVGHTKLIKEVQFGGNSKKDILTSNELKNPYKLPQVGMLANKSEIYSNNIVPRTEPDSYLNISRQIEKKLGATTFQKLKTPSKPLIKNGIKPSIQSESKISIIQKESKSPTRSEIKPPTRSGSNPSSQAIRIPKFHIKNSFRNLILSNQAKSESSPLRPSSQYARLMIPSPSYLENLRISPIHLEKPISQSNLIKKDYSIHSEKYLKRNNEYDFTLTSAKIKSKEVLDDEKNASKLLNCQFDIDHSTILDSKTSKRKLNTTTTVDIKQNDDTSRLGNSLDNTHYDLFLDDDLMNFGPWDQNPDDYFDYA